MSAEESVIDDDGHWAFYSPIPEGESRATPAPRDAVTACRDAAGALSEGVRSLHVGEELSIEERLLAAMALERCVQAAALLLPAVAARSDAPSAEHAELPRRVTDAAEGLRLIVRELVADLETSLGASSPAPDSSEG
jgi:hypothetical protein